MDELKHLHTDKQIHVFVTIQAEGKDWDPVKLAQAPPPPPPRQHTHTLVIHYGPFRTVASGTFIVVLLCQLLCRVSLSNVFRFFIIFFFLFFNNYVS